MYQEIDFQLQPDNFCFRKDVYPLARIHDIRVKKLGFFDNIVQLLFWIFIFSGAVWLATPLLEQVPLWWQILVACLTIIGFVFAVFRLARYALQIEFMHVDETGLQWVNIARSYSRQDSALFEQQVLKLKAVLSSNA
ncbi:hypothetical protein VA7868_04036 [Vibrio aerogenes CECT 7868]|uniref:Uncharacterized protein n=1 Tax=Vibrio aerogenes CECT 7868 TaxID=1216006 RepID=A0A1M6CKR2_9VIBR|nr:hypothetical protein [Vibrio aerogenes]SHI61354.1 hypothetical protein VA7868_04036 [Vibrio aerogenes CECT 7868]